MTKALFLHLLIFLLLLHVFGVAESTSKTLPDEEQLVVVGAGAFKDGFYDLAERHLSDFVAVYPNHRKFYDACYLLGKTLTMDGKLKEAKDTFLKIIAGNKGFDFMDYTFFWVAQIEMRLGNLEGAKRYLLEITQRFPKFEWIDYTTYLLGLLDLKVGNAVEAESFLKKVLQESRRQQLTRSTAFWLGICAFKTKQYEGAMNYFQTLGANDPAASSEHERYALFWLAEAQVKLGRFEDAKNSLQLYLDRFRNDGFTPAVLWRLGFCEYRLGQAKEARDTFKTLSDQFKDSRFLLLARYLLGKLSLIQGDYPASVEEFDFILGSPQGTPLWAISLLAQYWNHIQLGAREEANRTFQKLVKLGPFEPEQHLIQWLNAEVYFSEGRILDSLPYFFNLLNTPFREKALLQIGKGYFFEKKYREAITNLDLLFLEFPNSRYLEEGLWLKGEALTWLQETDQAMETYHLVLQQKANPSWHLLVWTELGDLYRARNEIEKAENAFKKVIEMSPSHPLSSYAAFQLGNLEIENKGVVEALHYYSIVLKGNISEFLGETYFSLGEVFYLQENYEKAFASFETALRYLKENSPFFFLTQLEMGNLQRRWDKEEEAKRSYRTILDHSTDEEICSAARELLKRIEAPQ